jgi:hypothetical protein
MRKYFASLLLSIFLASAASAQSNPISYRDGDEFRGFIRSVQTEHALVSRQNDEVIEGPRVLLQTRKYSPDGRRCETIAYQKDGSQRYKDIYIYNDAGKLAEKDTFNEQDVLTRKQVNSFDEGGRLIEETAFNTDGTLQQRKVFIYSSAKDRLLEIVTYDGNGMVIRRDVNSYDYQNRKSTWHTEEPDGTRSEQTFDLNAPEPRLQEYISYNAGGAVARTHVSSNDYPVHRIEGTDYNADGAIVRKESQNREFDSQRNITKITWLRWNKERETFEPFAITYNIISYY